MNDERPSARLRPLGLVALLVFAALSIQLTRMQLLDPAVAPELASGDQPRVVETEAPRGLIYDRNGLPLVRNVPRYVLRLIPAALPEAAADRTQVLVQIQRQTGVALADLERISTSGIAAVDPLVPIELHEVDTALEAIELRAATAALPGIDVVAIPKRVYEGGELLAHILGHVGAIDAVEVEQYLDVGYPLNALVGRSGLEEVYEDSLRGEPARRLVVADPTGRELGELGRVGAQPGADLVLSIDLGLQTAGLLDGDDAVLGDLVHRVSDGVADGRVAVGADGGDPADVVAPVHLLGLLLQVLDHRHYGGVDAALQVDRRHPGFDQLQTALEQ